MVYKWCIVPQCTNTSKNNPQKLFVSVPTNPERRKMWLRRSRRDPESILSHTNAFMCEDHFDMEIDTINYMKYKMGFSQRILLRNETVPTKFHCQVDHKHRPSKKYYHKKKLCDPGPSREEFLKRQRVDLVTECLQSQNATETHAESLQKDDNIIRNIPAQTIKLEPDIDNTQSPNKTTKSEEDFRFKKQIKPKEPIYSQSCSTAEDIQQSTAKLCEIKQEEIDIPQSPPAATDPLHFQSCSTAEDIQHSTGIWEIKLEEIDVPLAPSASDETDSATSDNVPAWASDLQRRWAEAEERQARALERLAVSMGTITKAVNTLAANTVNTQQLAARIEMLLQSPNT